MYELNKTKQINKAGAHIHVNSFFLSVGLPPVCIDVSYLQFLFTCLSMTRQIEQVLDRTDRQQRDHQHRLATRPQRSLHLDSCNFQGCRVELFRQTQTSPLRSFKGLIGLVKLRIKAKNSGLFDCSVCVVYINFVAWDQHYIGRQLFSAGVLF